MVTEVTEEVIKSKAEKKLQIFVAIDTNNIKKRLKA